MSGAQGVDGGNLRVALTSADGTTAYAKAERLARLDVDAHFHLTTPTRAGFSARLNLSAMHGSGTFQIVQDSLSGAAVCGPVIAIDRRP